MGRPTLVILSAFGGRLKSEPMEWPLGDSKDIVLPMMQRLDKSFMLGKDAIFDPMVIITEQRAIFAPTDKFVILPNRQTAQLFEMIDVR